MTSLAPDVVPHRMSSASVRPSPRSRKLIRCVFLVVLALLVAQAAYSYAAQEPYPSFIFPSFAGAPDDVGGVRVLGPDLAVRFSDSDRPLTLSYDQLLAPAPSVVAKAIAYTVLAPRSTDAHPRSTLGLFRLFLEQPRFTRGTRSLPGALRDPTTVDWLRGRLTQLFPGRTARSLEITWEQRRFAADETPSAETTTPVARFVVPLEAST